MHGEYVDRTALTELGKRQLDHGIPAAQSQRGHDTLNKFGMPEIQQPIGCSSIPPRDQARSRVDRFKEGADSTELDVVCAAGFDALEVNQRYVRCMSQLDLA